jgi:uncharacterized protein (TIGR02217 family)
MSNLVFPVLPGMTFPVVKTPMWKTTIQEAMSGTEVRFGHWSFPRWKWGLQYEFLRDTATKNEFWTLIDFYNRHYGSQDDWLFEDPDDKSVTDMQFGTGDGTTTKFQLTRSRGVFIEPVQNVNNTTPPVIKKSGVVQTNLTQYTIDSKGVVTFAAAPVSAAPLLWTGSFYWRCRFLDDSLDLEKFVKSMWELGKLEFLSVR